MDTNPLSIPQEQQLPAGTPLAQRYSIIRLGVAVVPLRYNRAP